MTDRELMQMALDALEEAADHIGCPDDDDAIGVTRKALRARLAQPEREWQGLTKEEAREISLANRPYVVDMIAALEARLKEKNT